MYNNISLSYVKIRYVYKNNQDNQNMPSIKYQLERIFFLSKTYKPENSYLTHYLPKTVYRYNRYMYLMKKKKQ